MSERRIPESETRQRGYFFDNGVAEVLKLLEKKLREEDVVIIGIHGSSINVGKTQLAGRLGNWLIAQDIPHVYSSDFEGLSRGNASDNIGVEKELRLKKNKLVIILEAMTTGAIKPEKIETVTLSENQTLLEISKKLNLHLKKIDVRILIQRPDKLFQAGTTNLADILITNEKAVDK
ncbi:MAG: hypothetical protein COT92_01735 [Candidatus Doudnabacteria bacterium CG10_big_fil_rev_8_21_14_0_10_42_18]|uniref:Uncharacterized protein n=1 Tax=Candidatus Doudnabacteria bacterium CG10_big_fil_rev_8_21_14_0_10_42_18 TaxID=1974552 RepID=A0A2H0VB56_9BACT|nr:MAG: hypothetical protein COT92_01735 [Candidatus Doudnabacteria bacterium CG10_big_fil_rev_8_21_14_0_10_42_18]